MVYVWPPTGERDASRALRIPLKPGRERTVDDPFFAEFWTGSQTVAGDEKRPISRWAVLLWPWQLGGTGRPDPSPPTPFREPTGAVVWEANLDLIRVGACG